MLHLYLIKIVFVMPTKQTQGPSLYKTFISAYMKAHPNEKRAVISIEIIDFEFDFPFLFR